MLPRPLPRRRRNSAVSIWLFNVAGASRVGQIVDLDEADWDFTIDLVQKGVFLCTKHEARHIREHGRGGAIVNVSSLNAHVPSPYGSAYATGKAGVEMFSKKCRDRTGCVGDPGQCRFYPAWSTRHWSRRS